VTEVARRMCFGSAFAYRRPAEIFPEYARLSAFENGGTRDFDIGAAAEISGAEYDELEPFQWPKREGATPARLLLAGVASPASAAEQLS
jgi:assimilatory nitrate reductase catalytic subunit